MDLDDELQALMEGKTMENKRPKRLALEAEEDRQVWVLRISPDDLLTWASVIVLGWLYLRALGGGDHG